MSIDHERLEVRRKYAEESQRFYAAMLKRDNAAAAKRGVTPSPKKKRLTTEQRREIKRMRQEGMRVVDVAAAMGVNQSTVTMWANRSI